MASVGARLHQPIMVRGSEGRKGRRGPKSIAKMERRHDRITPWIRPACHLDLNSAAMFQHKEWKSLTMQGRPSPLRKWFISPCFRFPHFSVENFHNFTSSRNNFRFSSSKISDDLFLFRENYYFTYFSKYPPDLVKLTCFYIPLICIFRFPPSLTMMHLCITQCSYWTLLSLTIIVLNAKNMKIKARVLPWKMRSASLGRMTTQWLSATKQSFHEWLRDITFNL